MTTAVVRLSHKIALAPNNKQRSHFAQAAGNARYAYNAALAAFVNAQRDADHMSRLTGMPIVRPPILSGYEMRKRFAAETDGKHPFMRLTTKHAYERAIYNLGDAFKRFLKGLGGFPKFKKKGKSTDRFCIGQTKVGGKRLWVPRLGWVKMTERLRFAGRILRATISRTADRWFVSINVELTESPFPPHDDDAKSNGAVGLDAGLASFMTLSNGEKIDPPQPLRRYLRKLRRLSKELHRRARGSANRRKTQLKLARLHARIANIRRNFQHQLSTAIARRFSSVAIESLAIPNMLKNRRLAMSISDAGWSRFFDMLRYKTALRGGELVAVDQWEPTTKRCSACKAKVASIPLSVRAWACPKCGTEHDRDVNAAINIKDATWSGESINACGDGREAAAVKQELNISRQSDNLMLF